MVFIMTACELVLFILISSTFLKAYSEILYSIPRPEILVTTRGFRVTIPNEAGMEMFFFHGSINRKIVFLEPGTITKSTQVATNGKWILENNAFDLKVGDIIYFWLYVKKNGKGYTRPYDSFLVTAILPYYPQVPLWYGNAIPAAVDSSVGHLRCQYENRVMKETIMKQQAKIAILESRLATPTSTTTGMPIPRMGNFDKGAWVWT